MRSGSYPEYRDSGVAYLESIPASWRTEKLKHIAKYWVSNVNKVAEEYEIPIRLCNYTDVYYNESIDETQQFMETTATFEEIARFSLKEGDVVITKDSESWDDIAVPSLVKKVNDLVCGYHLAFIRSNQNHVLGRFLFRYLQSPQINQHFQVAATGVTRFGLPKDEIGSVSIALPSIPEQHKICGFIDHKTDQIDSLIRKKEKLIEKLEEKRSALISRTVTRGLPPDAAKAAGLNPQPEMKDSGVKWIGEIPEHWEVKRVKNVSGVRYGLGEPPDTDDAGLPFIRATDIKRGRIDMTAVRRVNSDDVPWNRNPGLNAGEILIVRSGAYTGDSALVTSDAVPSVAGYDMVVTIRKGIPEFFAFSFLSKYFLEGQIHVFRMRAAQPHLNAEELGGFYLLTPPFEEQKAIANYLNVETEKLNSLVSLVGDVVSRLHEYRSALISAAVTGKIDVRNYSGD